MTLRRVAVAAFVVACMTMVLSVTLFFRSWSTDKAIVDNRVQATIDGCHQRNTERKIQREGLDDQINQTATLPDRVFRQFGISRHEAIVKLQKRRARLPPVNCKALAAAVRKTGP